MLSADVSQELQNECRDAGFDAFLSKPIQSDTLLATLARLTANAVPAVPFAAPAPVVASVPAAPASGALLDFATLEQVDRFSQDREFVNGLISDFLAEAASQIGQIEAALVQQRPAESKRIAHALKGGALSVGAIALCTLCQQFDDLPVGSVMRDGHGLITRMRETLARTDNVLTPYRLSRLRSVGQAQLH